MLIVKNTLLYLAFFQPMPTCFPVTFFNSHSQIFPFYTLLEYSKLCLFFFIAFLLCYLLALVSNFLTAEQLLNIQESGPYECGYDAYDEANRVPFDVHFYVVGILFLIFDVEVALIFPWIFTASAASFTLFTTLILFISILFAGFVYEWRANALSWPVVTPYAGAVPFTF
jgi:NADH-quinone oxidoreductase subunit A